RQPVDIVIPTMLFHKVERFILPLPVTNLFKPIPQLHLQSKNFTQRPCSGDCAFHRADIRGCPGYRAIGLGKRFSHTSSLWESVPHPLPRSKHLSHCKWSLRGVENIVLSSSLPSKSHFQLRTASGASTFKPASL